MISNPQDYKDGVLIDFTQDLSGNNNSQRNKRSRERAQDPYADGVDLSSGYPKHLIWTTKDNRRIPIPMMTDSHLLNTIAFLRRRVEVYRKMAIAQIALDITNNVVITRLFDLPDSHEEEFIQANERLRKRGHEIFNLSPEEVLHKFLPQYKHLYQEAYKRKILIEIDKGKVTTNG